jgi:hypothetical protein
MGSLVARPRLEGGEGIASARLFFSFPDRAPNLDLKIVMIDLDSPS